MQRDIDTQKTEIRDFFKIPIGHYPDKSTRWLFKVKENVRGLIEIIDSELAEHLDFSGLVELNTSYVSDSLKELESDMVFSVPFRHEERSDDDELLIYILIEHQSTVDPMMAFRVLYYMCQIWDAQRRELADSDVPRSKWRLRPILPIVFYRGAQRWQTPLSLTAVMDVPEVLARFVPSFDTLFLGVKDTDETNLTKTGHPLGYLLTVLQKEHADRDTLLEAMRAAFSYLDTLEPEQAAEFHNAILYLWNLVVFRRPTDEREDFIQLMQAHAHGKEVENMWQTTAEVLIEQGKVEGIEQGKVEGIEQGERKFAVESILDLLGMRFPSEDVQSLKPKLEEISDLNLLKTLNRATYATESFMDFMDMLQNNT